MSLTNKKTNKKKDNLERKRLRELERRKLKLGQLCQDSDEDEDESMELVRKKLDDCDIGSNSSLIYAPRDVCPSADDALIYVTCRAG
jgi:hypothetical protein